LQNVTSAGRRKESSRRNGGMAKRNIAVTAEGKHGHGRREGHSRGIMAVSHQQRHGSDHCGKECGGREVNMVKGRKEHADREYHSVARVSK
jgi:hypothetical protein